VRRTLSEEAYEKEAVQKTANELRISVKKLEAEKIDSGRVIQELRQNIARAFNHHHHHHHLYYYASRGSIR